MTKYFLDAGTTYSKILEADRDKKKYRIIETSKLSSLNYSFELSTGHGSKNENYENEVVALSFGTKNLKNATVLDIGSRDAKWVRFKDGKFKDMDWNTNCASATGATVEMLLKFYNVNKDELVFSSEKYPVTCGIFGLEKIMDDVSKGCPPENAVSKFITGIAFNAYNFTKKPDKIYLSGGFCENKCFTDALSNYTKVVPLGRFCLVDGLYNIYLEQNDKNESLL